ncbi:MAG TPA: site-specific DNA-methyltransferase, partial [Ktedonobacteraceae bacterium]|nr:site-specific DNA-methyltransferase [Ktedonobacteraceae bacterium]
MAIITWKGKQPIDEQNLLSTTVKFQTLEILPTSTAENTSSNILTSLHDWHNRLISGDKNTILPALLPEFVNAIDLIYIDPPFMTGRDFTIGTQIAYSDKWQNDLDGYLQWLYETFQLLHLLLSQHGSLYVHLDWRTTHYAKLILDEIFGFNPHTDGPGFKSEIIWHYQTGGRSQKCYARKHDTILLYTKSADYSFHGERIGERRGTQQRNHMRKNTGADGRVSWSIRSAGRLYTYHEDTIMTPSDVWNDISHLHQKDPERNGYATQKPSALLERIILASSEENDLVLDCFCGSGVTPVVAEQLGRRWIACDQSHLAIQLTQQRL